MRQGTLKMSGHRKQHISDLRRFARGALVLLATAVLSTNIGSRPAAAQAASEKSPCQQIKTACTDAGFKPGAAREGVGLVVDCIRPVMQGVPQRARATQPLPLVDAGLIAACKAKNPDFGQEKAKPQ
jgi:hypothetical protein